MQMRLSSSLSTHWTLTQAFLTFKTLFNRSLPGWVLIFLLFTPLRLNSCSSDSKTNLPKYTTLHLTPPTLLEILASPLTNILPSLTKLHLSPQPVTITFVNFAVSSITPICQQPVPLLPLLFTPNLITLIVSIILNLNYPVSSRYRTLLLVLLLKLLSPVISLHPTSSSSDVTIAHPPTLSSLKITDCSFCYASPCLWYQLQLFVNLILVPVPPFPTYLFLYPLLLRHLIHHSADILSSECIGQFVYYMYMHMYIYTCMFCMYGMYWWWCDFRCCVTLVWSGWRVHCGHIDWSLLPVNVRL